MAQTEFERGFIAGANYMQREAASTILDIDYLGAIPKQEEAKK